MTDTYPGFFGEYPSSGKLERRLHWLLAARLLLAGASIALVFFLLQWSSAIRIWQDSHLPPGTLAEAAVLNGKTVRLQWNGAVPIDEALFDTKAANQPSRVVVPQYAGGGRGSTLVGLKSWRFGTIYEHPIWFASCAGVALVIGGAFAACTFWASRLKRAKSGIASESVTFPEAHADQPEAS
jgi:hypothetical protein